MKKNAFAICILMILVPFSGCVDSVGNDILDESQKITSWEENIEFLSPLEGDWVEGEFGVTVTTIGALEAEYLELWVNGQLRGNESMDDSVIFSIDTSSHSDGTGAPVRLELEIRVETHGIGVMNLTAIFPQRLTDSLAEDIQPEWNTEGDTLLFKSSRGLEEGLYEIYKLTPDGSEPSRVNTEQSYHGYPGWSPDGTHVVFNSWVYGNESGNRQMEIFTANISTGETHRVTDNSAFDDSGRWSPDGSEIIFYSNRDGTMDLWKVPVIETGEPTGPPVKLVGTDAREHCGRWSSDGEWIVYESDQSGNNDIWVVPSDGEESIQVTFDDYEDGYPAWSPDGTNIVYNSLRGINGDLHILSLTDGVLHRLTSDPAIDAHPTWSADGRHIAFHSDRSGNFDIWVVEIPLINSNESS
ncbi:MAG: hypothetical protein VX224_03290 [Candidatus Thermoplasmatota archaeon]|nr:hypothetical protein [Candidatus Thermoplasmatota archaeon]